MLLNSIERSIPLSDANFKSLMQVMSQNFPIHGRLPPSKIWWEQTRFSKISLYLVLKRKKIVAASSMLQKHHKYSLLYFLIQCRNYLKSIKQVFQLNYWIKSHFAERSPKRKLCYIFCSVWIWVYLPTRPRWNFSNIPSTPPKTPKYLILQPKYFCTAFGATKQRNIRLFFAFYWFFYWT